MRGWTRSPWFRRRLICNGSFASCADCRLPGSSGHPSSLSERNGLQAPQPPALVTVEPPLAADIVGCPGERVNDGPPEMAAFGILLPLPGRRASLAIVSALDGSQYGPTAAGCVSY